MKALPPRLPDFLSTASKAAGFAVIMRLLTVVFPVISADWSMILAVLATLTMTVGNLIALAQKNIKRMLAYSSIAHAGYAMIGVVAFSQFGIASTVFYLIAYILTNLLAFGIVGIVGHVTTSDDLSAYNGLGRRNPPCPWRRWWRSCRWQGCRHLVDLSPSSLYFLQPFKAAGFGWRWWA